jgi:hypothetical protein
MGGVLGEDGGLGDIKLQSCVLLEDTIYLRQNLKCHGQLDLDVFVIHVSNPPVSTPSRIPAV